MTTIGRDSELQLLQNYLREASHGYPEIVIISGELGVGKTHLLHEFADRLTSSASNSSEHPMILRASCIPQVGRSIGYQPFIALLESYNQSREIRTNLSDVLIEVAPDWLQMLPTVGTAASKGIRALGHLVNSFLDPQFKPSLQADRDIYRQYFRVLQAISKNRPAIFCIDDFQWSDESSQSMLYALSGYIKEQPSNILIIVCGRDELLSLNALTVMTQQNKYRGIRLGPLTYEQMKQLFSFALEEVGVKGSFPVLEQGIWYLSRGNPLFIRELVRASFGVATKRAQIESAPADQANPHTFLSAIFKEKFDGLGVDDRDLLTSASIQGNLIGSELLSISLTRPHQDVVAALSRLITQDKVLVENGWTNLPWGRINTYSFSQPLMQVFIYERLTEEQRMMLHENFALALEGKALPDAREVLAIHFRLAGDAPKTSLYALLAADRQVQERRGA